MTCIAGIATRKQFAEQKKTFKRRKKAGVTLDNYLDLLNWGSTRKLPAKREEMAPHQLYVVPMDMSQHLNVQAVALTARTQVGWIEQLTKLPKLFVLHIDGKHKIHFGKWIMITVGTHSIEFHNSKISHSFRPLTYMFSKQHESTDAIRFLLQALNKYCAARSYHRILNAY